MKKILVAIGTISLFVLYSLGVRHQQSPGEQVAAATNSQPSSTVVATPGQYKNGSYTGPAADAFYGNVQVQAIVRGGKLSDIPFLSYPTDHRDSVFINQQA